MLLIIDPSEKIFHLKSDPDEKIFSKIKSIYKHKNISENIEISLPTLNLLFPKVISNMLRELMTVPLPILRFIDEVNVINLFGGVYELQPIAISTIFNSLETDNPQSLYLKSLKEKVRIKALPFFNERGFADPTKAFQINFLEIIQSEKDNSSIIFFDTLLTNIVTMGFVIGTMAGIKING